MTAAIEHQRDVRALIDAAKAGDRDAFGALYERYKPTVFFYIYYKMRDRPLVEDLTQEVFRRVLISIRQYEHRGKDFGAYLVTIARNLIADHYKSAAVRAPKGELPEDWIDRDRWRNPEQYVAHGAMAATLTEALGRLSDGQRLCVESFYLRGRSIAETAAIVGMNQGAVKALIFRATRALRRDPDVWALR